jgi:pantoate--beta-alanine ligase
MHIVKTCQDLGSLLARLRQQGAEIGFVPTMGALHAGHISLINAAKSSGQVTVCSIFVNPTQFNDPKDFAQYPITIERDIELLALGSCDVLFIPSVQEMYPAGMARSTALDIGYLATILEGSCRPGHFDGMAQIVERLLRVVQPDSLYMGQKDYQQAMICRLLVTQLDLGCELVVCPIAREPDGLAMSSRNVRLDPTARALAVELSRSLRQIAQLVSGRATPITIDMLVTTALDRLAAYPDIAVEYLAIRHRDTLQPIDTVDAHSAAVALIAARMGGVRLIDNMLVGG